MSLSVYQFSIFQNFSNEKYMQQSFVLMILQPISLFNDILTGSIINRSIQNTADFYVKPTKIFDVEYDGLWQQYTPSQE